MRSIRPVSSVPVKIFVVRILLLLVCWAAWIIAGADAKHF